MVSYKGQLVGGDMTLCTPAVRFPDVCEKKVFRFFRSSANGKPHIELQFVSVVRLFLPNITWRYSVLEKTQLMDANY